MRKRFYSRVASSQRVWTILISIALSAGCGAADLPPELKNAVIVFGGEASYPPFEWREQGAAVGLNVDLQQAIAEAGGIQARHKLGNWPDVVRDLHSGAVDVVAMFYSEERRRDFRFTQPFEFVNHAIYALEDSTGINSVAGLSASRVAVENLSYAHQRLLEAGGSPRLVLAENTVEALEAVQERRADYAILSEPAADYLINSRQMGLRPIGLPLWPAEYVFAVRKDRTQLARWLDEQLDVVMESGRYHKIQANWKERMVPLREHPGDTWLAYVLLPLIVLVLIGSWWVWSLRRKLGNYTRRLIDESGLLKQAESKLSWATDHYSDTEMPKQHHFAQVAARLLAENSGGGRKFVVAALKLADLERTIRTLGHEQGFAAVRQFARQLHRADFSACGQMGRDVFMVFGEKAKVEREFRNASLGETIVMRTPNLRVFAGAAVWPQHGDTMPELLRKAESALSRAVERREGWVEFRPFMEPDTEALRLISLFRKEGADAIYPVFQPQIDLATGAVVGAEALARWEVAGLGPISPGTFIPLLEDAGLIAHVTRRMVTEGVRVAARLRRSGCPCPVSVNVTGNDLLGWKLSRSIFNALREYGGTAADLKLELTETGVVDRPEILQWKMRRLVKDGIDISVDDFGTGYSSLAYLSDFPVREIKIDQSFIHDMMRQKKDMGIVTSTISMGHDLDLTVVAEGVETQEALDVLRRHGCDRAQGYFISRPLAENDFVEFVMRKKNASRSVSKAKNVRNIHRGFPK